MTRSKQSSAEEQGEHVRDEQAPRPAPLLDLFSPALTAYLFRRIFKLGCFKMWVLGALRLCPHKLHRPNAWRWPWPIAGDSWPGPLLRQSHFGRRDLENFLTSKISTILGGLRTAFGQHPPAAFMAGNGCCSLESVSKHPHSTIRSWHAQPIGEGDNGRRYPNPADRLAAS